MAIQTAQERFRDKISGGLPSIWGTAVGERKMKQNEGLPLFGNATGNNFGAYLGNFFGGAGSQFFGGLGDIATFVGADTPANFLYDISDKIEERLPEAKPAEWSWDYFSSPNGLWRGTGNIAGSIASILLPTLAMPESAPATIGRGLAAIPKFGKLFSTANPANVGRFFTSGVPEAAMEAGNNYRNAVSQGMNPQEAWNNRWGVFGRNAAFLPISNAVQYGLFTKLLGGRPLLSATGEVLSQGGEEWWQKAIENQALGKPFTYNPIEAATNPDKYKEQTDAFNAGIIDFLPVTAAGLAFGGARNRFFPEKTENTDNRQETPPQETTNIPTEITPQNENATGQPILNTAGQELTPKQAEIWDAAQYASARAKEKFNIDLPPELIYKQWAHEAGVNFDSENARYNNNFGGLTQTEPNGEENKQPDGNNYYRHFNNVREYADAYIDDFIQHRPEISGVKNEREFAQVMHDTGYFSDSIENYASGMEGIAAPSSRTNFDSEQDSDEDIYVGENGKGEGNYWQKQHDGVSFEGAQPDLLNAVDMLGKWFYDKTGKRLVVTAGTNGDHPSNGSEHGHDAGWKVDVNDWDGESDGYLVTADGSKGTLTDEFIAYGRSLGLGMNWEGDHIDVALDGTQWDGNGENAGGFNPKNGRSRKGKGGARTAGATPDDEDSDIQPAKTTTFDDVIKSILQDNNNAQFNMNSDDDGTLQAISDFAKSKRDTATGEAAMVLQNLFTPDGQFIQSRKNLRTLNEIFGDELKEFGQGKFNRRWSDLLQKSMTPNFIENLTDDDKRLFGNILKQKLKDAGIDLNGMPAVKQGLEKGDEKTFVNAWQALQDRMNKTETAADAEPMFSAKTQKALDDIANRVDELTTSTDENAQQQIIDNSKLFKEIGKLEGEINKLNSDREKLSQAKGNQAAKVDAAGKIAKIDADIKKKQAELDAKIDSFYNPPQPPQPVKVEPSERFAPIKAQADNAIENLNQQIETLRGQGLDYNSPEIIQLTDKLMDIQTRVDELAQLDGEVGTAVNERNSAAKAKDNKAYSKAKNQVARKSKKYDEKEQELDNILNPQPEPEPVEVEPSKFFTSAKAQADDAISNLNQQIETLRAQGLDDDSPEIEELTDKKYAIQAVVDELAKSDADAETAKKKKAEANKANDTKAYNTAESQRKKAVKSFNNQKKTLDNLLNVQPESAPVEEEPVELGTEFANELNAIQQRKKELRDSGAPAKDITALNQRRDRIKKDGTEIAKLKKQVEDLDNQIQAEKDPQKRETLEDTRDDLQAQIEDKSQKLSNFINPQPKPQKKAPKNYAPVDDRVKDEISRLNKQILNAPDSEMPEAGKGDTPTSSATKRRKKLVELNNAVGQAQDDVLEKGKALQEARANGDEQAQVAAKSAFETAKENLAQKKKELDDFLALPVKKETQAAPRPEHYEPTGEAKEEIDKLNAEIEELRGKNERENSAEISAKSKRRDAIQNQVDKIGNLEEQRDKKVAERTQAEADGKRQTANRLTGEIADKEEKIKANRKKLNDLLHPRNEDEEPAETYLPVDDKVKAAFEELDRQIAQAPDGSAEKQNLEQKRRELETQNETVARLREEKKQLEKDLSRKQKGSKGYKKTQNALDNKNRALANAEKRLSKLTETPKPKETKQEQPKPKKSEPIDTETKTAIVKLKRDIKKLNAQIEDVETDFLTGKGNSEKLEELTKSRDEKKALLKQIQAQSDKCSDLKDKAAKALRIMNDSTKPQAERDKARDALSDYGTQLREELQNLHDLIPQEENKKAKPVKEKETSKAQPAKADESQPQATPPESETTSAQPARESQPEPQESAPESKATPEQPETNAQPETQAEESSAQPTEPKQSKKKSAKGESKTPKEPQQDETAKPERQETESESKADEEEYTTDDGSTFGSIEAAEREMIESLKELGIEPLKKENTPSTKEDTRRPKLVNFVEDDSDEALNREIAELQKELNKVSSMPMFNPKIWKSALKIGAIYVQRGINNFADWARKMTEAVGTKIEPWNSAIWETINNLPEGTKFDEKQMLNVSRFIGALREKGEIESFGDVQAQFEQRYGKEAVEKILPMIRASYTGIEKYFADQMKREAKAAQKTKKEPTNPLEKAAQKIADLIDEWNEKSLDAWKKANPHRIAPPTKEAQELSEMVLNGTVTPDKAVDAANKLLNGDGKEQNKAREILYDARDKMKEKAAQSPTAKPESEPTAESQDEESTTEQERSRQDKGGIFDEQDEAEDENQLPTEKTDAAETEETTDNEPIEDEEQPQADNEETPVETEETEPNTNEIVYPEGALTYGDMSAVEAFKGGRSDEKIFDENMNRRVTINGQEMTRLEAVEAMAKGEIREDAMKLNEVEKKYLDWLKKSLIEPLKAIQRAGIQNDKVLPYNYAMTTGLTNSIGMSRNGKDALTLTNLTKLADVFGGKTTENKSSG